MLNPAHPLPMHIDLGEISCSWVLGKFKFETRREGFRKMTSDELMQLVGRLQAIQCPHIILLNLDGHKLGFGMMREIAGSITALINLEVFVLVSKHPFSF